jgi:phage terminase large subunit-like protein
MEEREAINKIRKIEKILSDRERVDTLARYNSGEKIHLKQMAFHKCKKRNRWVFGGNRSGKTECGAVETVWRARGIHPYQENKANIFGWVVSVSYEVQRDVAQSKVLNYLNPDWIEDIIMHTGSKSSAEYGVIDTIVVKNVFGGLSKIGFKSADQGREKFQGASLDFVWFDEEPPKDIYEECKMRVLDKKGTVYGTMTPLKGLTWVYDEIYLNKYDSKEVFYIQMEWADNPFLDADEIVEINSSLSEDSLSSRRYGHFDTNCGLVYPEFDENIHVIDPFDVPIDWQDKISIDPGLRNPLSAHFYCVDNDDNIYIVAEHYEKDKDIDYHSDRIKEIAKSLNWHHTAGGYLEAIIDSAASQRTLSATKSVAELFCERGIVVNCNVNKELFSGINRVKGFFSPRPPKIFIFRNCTNMIREIKSYWWGKADNPIKKDDHAMDELRYYIMTRPHYNTPKKPAKTLMQKHYDRLLRASQKQL